MRAKVFCVLKKLVAELKGKEGVRILRNGGMEVECRLTEVRIDGLRTVYAIEPLYPISGKHYFELQLIERGERNVGEIVTNFSGKKLIPRWRGTHTVGFRTSRGQLLAIVGYAVRGLAELIIYRLSPEGRTVYLVEETVGTEGKLLIKARYEDDTWVIALPRELEHLAEAVAAAMEKAECNCFKKGCKYHYALSEEEAQQVLAERREKQKAAAQTQKTTEKPVEEPTIEEEIATEEPVVSEVVSESAAVTVETPAPVEPAVFEVPAAQPVAEKPKKAKVKKAKA